jgi:hypothetical protein
MKSASSNTRLLKHLSIIFCLMIGLVNYCFAQTIENADNSKYDSIIKKISDLNPFDLKKYTELIIINEGGLFKEYIGWKISDSNGRINLFEITGWKTSISKNRIETVRTINNYDSLSYLLKDYWQWCMIKGNNNLEMYGHKNMMSFYLISLWLNQTGHRQNAYQVLSCTGLQILSDSAIQNIFGNMYYNNMLVAYSLERNYEKAISYGSHLTFYDFNKFRYVYTANALTDQLKERQDDFKTFCLPDPETWKQLKNNMTRKEQIIYLIERLRLLNCIKWANQDDLDFADSQISVSHDSIDRDTTNYYWQKWYKYRVINPYNEILAMNPEINEIEIFLPYLLDTSYIPTYNYFREFWSERDLYRFNWVIEDLINHITGENFFDKNCYGQDMLYDFTQEIKLQNIEKIREWCFQNKDLSKDSLIRKIMIKTKKWAVFKNAMNLSVKNRYSFIPQILEYRFKDFHSFSWDSPQADIAKAMFELGTEKNIESVRTWYQNANTEGVKLWTSLFLIKYDKENYEGAFKTLKEIFEEDYYNSNHFPYAIPTLVTLKDKRAMPLAEKILNKESFKYSFCRDNYQGSFKILLLAKNEATFNFLYSGLLDVNVFEGFKWEDKKTQQLNCDPYVYVVDKWRSSEENNYYSLSIDKRKEYSIELAEWLKKQFKLVCADKKDEILMDQSDWQ